MLRIKIRLVEMTRTPVYANHQYNLHKGVFDLLTSRSVGRKTIKLLKLLR